MLSAGTRLNNLIECSFLKLIQHYILRASLKYIRCKPCQLFVEYDYGENLRHRRGTWWQSRRMNCGNGPKHY
jgi:hypothetical protein